MGGTDGQGLLNFAPTSSTPPNSRRPTNPFARDFPVLGGSLGLCGSESFEGVLLLRPGSVELELRAELVVDRTSLLSLHELVLVVLLLDVLLGTLPLLLHLSLELKNLNLSNIEFLVPAPPFCDVLLLDAVELVDVVLPELTALGGLSVVRGLAIDLPPGVGIPDPTAPVPGEVARDDTGLLFLALRYVDPDDDEMLLFW